MSEEFDKLLRQIQGAKAEIKGLKRKLRRAERERHEYQVELSALREYTREWSLNEMRGLKKEVYSLSMANAELRIRLYGRQR